MPIYSMTGYASAQASLTPETEGRAAAGTRLGLEIRSVNSRFLDLSFRMPEELRQHEAVLRELLSGGLKRGKVEVRAALESAQDSALAEPNPRLMQRLNSLQDTIQSWLPAARALSVADVIRLSASQAALPDNLGPTVATLAKTALKQLNQARAREGERLAQTLRDRVAQLRALAEQAAPLIPQLVDQQRQRFLERWREAMDLTEGAVLPEAAQDRALTEATAFAIRIDVAEELTRLSSHLTEIDTLLTGSAAKEGIGKRLDFLIQELHREANTLGSKSAALELTRISVDMKVLIEQMREQVQNLE